MPWHLLETRHIIPWQPKSTPKKFSYSQSIFDWCVTGEKAFTFSSWHDGHRISHICKATRKFPGVTSLTSEDFHQADVRSAGYRLCAALRVGGAVVALDGAGPAFRSCRPSVQPPPALAQRGCTCLAVPGAPEICMSLAEPGDGKHRIIPQEKHWFTTVGRDYFFLKLSDFVVWIIRWLPLR